MRYGMWARELPAILKGRRAVAEPPPAYATAKFRQATNQVMSSRGANTPIKVAP